ncbi:hypothetical protein FOVG_16576 [Fusarium oxysporum f. sp. pisi HDV247]|uniref:Uncharacterized protein n=1 Tax=Fusarium oxysporum f. sp. pisi HDV247 TaxID=1080344 RepID=W9NWR5_FUSOX|nr:hypothetical protein FOVG_16576 [Fusarium oxysporum f. sp. pisi HDV247]
MSRESNMVLWQAASAERASRVNCEMPVVYQTGGSGNLAVILLEPGDREAFCKYKDIIEDQSRASALRLVDCAL